jgi:predicted ATP-grasp superfamily ATP-dependent carboligase
MNLFVYEYTCAVGLGSGGEAAALRTEGHAMLAALLDDLNRIPGVSTCTLLDAPDPGLIPGGVCRFVRPGEEPAVFRELAGAADFTLVIAPEFEDLLLTRCRWVEEAGGRLLGPGPSAVALTADKLALSEHFSARGVRTPQTYPVVGPRRPEDLQGALVCKPRFGAGSQATRLLPTVADLPLALVAPWAGERIVQPFVSGMAASVAFLIGPCQCLPLPPATQYLSSDGCFHYLGGEVPLPPALAQRAARLAHTAVAVVPELLGYVGVDLVLGEAADGGQDWVIEINPRLTTSYLGLRALAATNLATALLAVVTGEPCELHWNLGTARFWPDGRLLRNLLV